MCATCLKSVLSSPLTRLQQRVPWLFLSAEPAFRKGLASLYPFVFDCKVLLLPET